ncbi:hypothetical protein GCM10012278_09000 [Nonomuraea glycinis]|uniref:Uncharacterized protein n=1 Tax=Nonomuraea glycinis TaxID=2047744 RepID=A0A918E277_9ACTN|nr:hypothetical protein GCM10012278_09000 [Nonomuraea glycinis]
MAQLLSHHLGAADSAVQHALIDEHQEHWRLSAVKDVLPPHAGFHTLIHLFGRDLRPLAEDVTGVCLGLQEAGDEQGIPGA